MRQQIGRPAISNRDFFVQTERKAHEEWAAMIVRAPMAAAVMHKLVALMDRQNAVAISHGTLAKLLKIHVNTVKTAIRTLELESWLQVVQLGQRGTVNAYVINDQVAWADDRQKLPFSMFSATIVADVEDQSSSTLTTKTLRRVPVLYAGERQFPVGDGTPPPSQPSLPSLEPDLPARRPSQLDIKDTIAPQIAAEEAAADAAPVARDTPPPLPADRAAHIAALMARLIDDDPGISFEGLEELFRDR